MNKKLRIDHIRAKLSSGGVVIGSWQQLPCTELAELMGSFGFQFVGVDLEHSNITRNQLPNIFRALEIGNTLPLARIAKPDPYLAVEAMEQGAGGIVVPQVRTGKQMSDIKDAIAYPPTGSRGLGFNRANGYGSHFHDYLEGVGQSPLLIPMIEHYEAIENINDILSEDVDAALIGPYDLSASIGCAGDFTTHEFQVQLDAYKKGCIINRVPIGYHIPGNHLSADPEIEYEQRISEGYKFIVYSGDVNFINRPRKTIETILNLSLIHI